MGSTFKITEPDDIWLGALVRATTAEIFTGVCIFTVEVLTMNVVMVAPAGIIKVGFGRVSTSGVSVESMAVNPPAGAGGEKVTVTVAVCPPSTSVGEIMTETPGGGGGSDPEAAPDGMPEQLILTAQKTATRATSQN